MKRINLLAFSLMMVLFILPILSGCFGENSTKKDESKELNTAKTEAALKGTDKLVQPPNNTNTNAPTYNITVEKGATINSPLLPPAPPPAPAEMKPTPPATQESSVERGIKDNSSNKLEEKSSSVVQSGWFWILVAIAVVLIGGTFVLIRLVYKKEIDTAEEAALKTKDVVVGGVEEAVKFVQDELAWAKPETAEHGMAERIQIKLGGLASLLGQAFKKK